MIKRISLLVTAALLVATMAMAGLAGPAFAASPESQCSGTYDNNKGDKSCTVTTSDPAGKSNNTFESTDTTTQQGRIGNDGTGPSTKSDKCTANPGGQPNGCK